MAHDHDHGIDKNIERQHLGPTKKTPHMSHGGLGVYMAVFGSLCVLTLISFLVGNSQSLRQNAPQVMWAAMMAVSVAKALLVMLFFMHLKWEANWKYVLTIPASMMSLFLVLMLVPDVGRRTRTYSSDRWLHAAHPNTENIEEQEADHLNPPAKSGKGH
jgi:cytochrome c oxidase subunit 4